MTVYLVSQRGTMHEGRQLPDGPEGEQLPGVILTAEGCNLDDANLKRFDLQSDAAKVAKRQCKRCMAHD